MKKRLISLVLAIVMLVGMIPSISISANATASKIQTNIELVDRLVNIAENYKTLYVMGAWGGPLTSSNKTRYINHHSYNQSAERTAMINAASSDTFAFDCVCLIKAVWWGWDGNTSDKNGGAKYATNGMGDIGTDSILDICSEVSSDFSDIEVGELLWMSGHVGIYIGDGKAVECTPSWKNGVQITDVLNIKSGTGHKWKKHGKLPDIKYVDRIVDDTYPAYCAIKINKDINVNSQPCEPTTDASSKTLEIARKDAQYQAIGLYMNKWGNLWYKVKLKESSGTGYLYAGNTTYLAHSINDIEPSGVTAPPTLTVGKAWSLTGAVQAEYNELTGVSVSVYNAQGEKETGGSASVSGNSYQLKGSTVDNKTEFDKLTVGSYTYVVSASYKYCYATSGKTYETKTDTIPVFQGTFKVEKSTTCSHSYTSKVTTEPTCGAKGVKTYTCSKCGASYTESIAATGNHSYTSKITTDETCTTPGVRTYTCSTCSRSYTEAIEPYGHSYTPWDTVSYADCVNDGVQERTCMTCLNVETQTIPAAGHSYTSKSYDATCTQGAKTVYTCSGCGDSYTEYASSYTEWSETYPEGVDTSRIESRTEYRSQTKKYATGASNTMDGWTLYDTTEQWSEYGSWSAWSDTAVTANDSTKVETRTVYKWYYYKCPSCGDHMHGHGITCPTWAGGCGKGAIKSEHYVVVWLTVSPDDANLKDFYGTGKYYATIDGQVVFKHSSPESKTQYRSSTRAKETTYHFYQWSNWTAWGTDKITETSDVKVETRTLYRYEDTNLPGHNYVKTVVAPTCTEPGYTSYVCSVCKDSYENTYVPAAGCTYSYKVTKAPTVSAAGALTGTCSGCAGTTTVTLPKLNTTDYTYSVTKEPSYTATGTGRYTWKTTTFGTFYFDVTLDKLVDSNAARIVVENVTAAAGDTVSVSVKLANNPGFGGMAYDVYYDNAILELVSYEMNLGSGICTDSGVATYADKVNFQYAGTANITGDGILVTFLFRVKENAETGLSVISVKPESGTVFRYDGQTEVDFELMPVNGGVTVTDYIKGDINGDGKVNNRDAARLMQHLAGWDVEYEKAALDVNGDGKVNNRDAARLLQYLAGWDVEIH